MAEAPPELAFRHGHVPPPADLPQGECTITSSVDGSIRVDHADPRILISAELLETIRDKPVQGVSLRMAPRSSRSGPIGIGSVLRIQAANRTVIYQVVDYAPSVHGYIGQWPD
jgi:hypothetical protein